MTGRRRGPGWKEEIKVWLGVAKLDIQLDVQVEMAVGQLDIRTWRQGEVLGGDVNWGLLARSPYSKQVSIRSECG